jgi:hypothetical protein
MITTQSGHNFLLYAAQGNEILIFATHDNMRLLCNSQFVSMDGTFDSCPTLYSQIFTLHVFEDNRLIPVVYSLLPDKRAATYVTFFNVIQNEAIALGLTFDPTVIMSDFESGIIRAVTVQFPNAGHRGCHFHFTQVCVICYKFFNIFSNLVFW